MPHTDKGRDDDAGTGRPMSDLDDAVAELADARRELHEVLVMANPLRTPHCQPIECCLHSCSCLYRVCTARLDHRQTPPGMAISASIEQFTVPLCAFDWPWMTTRQNEGEGHARHQDHSA
jgi:hypothetical protein